MSASVGDDIEAICGKCGDVWHVVVAKVGDQIAKVQCKQCGGYHKRRTRVSSASKTTRQRRVADAKSPLAPVVEANLNKPESVYRVSEVFEVGDRLSHPKFGKGIVESFPGPGKMDVFFPGGRRVLACAKPQSQLGDAPRIRFE